MASMRRIILAFHPPLKFHMVAGSRVARTEPDHGRGEEQEGWNESREGAVQPYDNTSADILQRIERSYIEDDEKAIVDRSKYEDSQTTVKGIYVNSYSR